MKVSYKIVQKRRDDIMTLIQKLGSVTVSALAREFHTSEITIRRDLQYWEDSGAIQRVHGGARLVQRMVSSDNVNYTNDRYIHAIAKYATGFVEDGDTIFINTSRTALLMIRYLRGKSCTIITNSAEAVLIPHDPKVQIYLTGGELHFPKKSMVGDFAISNITRVLANKCFLGCSGITAQDGITTAIMAETTINNLMLENTNGKRYILCDHTKIGAKYSFISSTLSKIDYVITDIAADQDQLSLIQAAGPKVIRLEPLQHVDPEAEAS